MKKRNVSLVIPTIKKTLLVTDEEENADTLSTALPRLPQDISSSNLERRTQIKSRLQEMPVNIATKIVGSSLREWGRTVGTGGNNASSSINLSRKYKVGESLKWISFHLLLNASADALQLQTSSCSIINNIKSMGNQCLDPKLKERSSQDLEL